MTNGALMAAKLLDADPFLNPCGSSIVVAVGAIGPLKRPHIDRTPKTFR
jgi:hypothetical protein